MQESQPSTSASTEYLVQRSSLTRAALFVNSVEVERGSHPLKMDALLSLAGSNQARATAPICTPSKLLGTR